MSRITFDPNQCGGRPCIRGMRIRVKDVLELLAAGETEESILADYPYLEREDVRAVPSGYFKWSNQGRSLNPLV
ncbi:DUF433 domain-containing protein [Nocardia sp. NBC_00508]|uniref:DUF433 domain-containing protein n=1 Tax=Nocardia sp. NBC_00508 TaxID=2975992 RepID=UPI002E800605|nr:DUF433 domain-containing protein [Nocardia sp. NBC_00508]WUD68779.1 DUF433 domain-containing protein [Nocardia sp. NBC_00508]